MILKIMKQNNSLKTKDMKKLYKILFEGKQPEEKPIKLEIKLKSTVTPNEQIDINQWYNLINNLNNKQNG